jgi:hypothetical protein
MINKHEVKQLDNRIKNCYIENPDQYSDEYYVKIFFKYKNSNDSISDSGRQEFTHTDKNKLLEDIKMFIKNNTDIIIV